jgi:hypothetical protein
VPDDFVNVKHQEKEVSPTARNTTSSDLGASVAITERASAGAT